MELKKNEFKEGVSVDKNIFRFRLSEASVEVGFGFEANLFCGDGIRMNGYDLCCERVGC